MTAKTQLSSLRGGWKEFGKAINLTNPKLQIRDTVRYERSPFEDREFWMQPTFFESWEQCLCLNKFYFILSHLPLKTLATFIKMTMLIPQDSAAFYLYLYCICTCTLKSFYFILSNLPLESLASFIKMTMLIPRDSAASTN